MMSRILKPETTEQLCGIFSEAAASQGKLILQGGGSKTPVGRPVENASTVDMRGFSGVVDYDPAELVLTVKAGTPLATVNQLVSAQGQALAFEPFETGRMFDLPDNSTIGGVVASGLSGSARLSKGSARDHLLGLEAVSGRGERFKAGAKVVKNVTGYDLPKLLTGSWGRLAALTEVTLKVLPLAPSSKSFLLEGLSLKNAVECMSRALGSNADIAAAAHIPGTATTPSLTALRLDGIPASITARTEILHSLFHDKKTSVLDQNEGNTLWENIKYVSFLQYDLPLWRVFTPPGKAPALIDNLIGADHQIDWMCDWGGALSWVATDAPPSIVAAAAETAGGHAKLFRASDAVRAATGYFPRQNPAIEALEERIRRAFDPAGVLETGRFD